MTSFRNPVKKDPACIAGRIGRVVLFHDQVDQLVLDHDGLDNVATLSQKPQYFRISSQ